MLVFSKPEYRDVCIDVMGDFLALAKTESLTRNSIAMHYEQKFDLLDIGEGCSLSLGRISILSSAITASLCVVLSNDAHPDFIKIVNPAEDVCKLEPQQTLDVVYLSPPASVWRHKIQCGVNGIVVELLDYRISTTSPMASLLAHQGFEEHYFRFRYSADSVEQIQHLPFGKHDAGRIVFREEHGWSSPGSVNILLNWREQRKNDVYKGLLLPKHSLNTPVRHYPVRKRRQVVQSNVTVRKLPAEDMETGCQTVFSRMA